MVPSRNAHLHSRHSAMVARVGRMQTALKSLAHGPAEQRQTRPEHAMLRAVLKHRRVNATTTSDLGLERGPRP